MHIKTQLDRYYLGFDVGGTKCSVVLGDQGFNVHEKIVFSTHTKRGYQKIINEFKKHTYALFEKYEKNNLVKIGISCGGPLDSEKGIIYSPPNLPGWDSVPIVDIFKEEFNIDVEVQNDANACALAEWMMGAGVGTKNMIFLTFGTGMGAGLIINGQLYAGTNDLAGEVGHIRMAEDGPIGFGKAGSFEGFCSGGGIAQLAWSIINDKLQAGETVGFCPSEDLIRDMTAKTVFEAAISGDPVAQEIVNISAGYLGKGLAILIDILNPECIVIGSIYARNEELFKPHIENILNQEAIQAAKQVCKIVPAALGDNIGDYAALCVALN
ncbi:MAG: ROK family protein [Bacteroidales bacterium]|nr:ROK family protein [Bacteroidales bacterium]